MNDNTDYVTIMVRMALTEARTQVNVGGWAFIKTYGPNVRLSIGRLNYSKDRIAPHKVISYYVCNNGKIGRDEL